MSSELMNLGKQCLLKYRDVTYYPIPLLKGDDTLELTAMPYCVVPFKGILFYADNGLGITSHPDIVASCHNQPIVSDAMKTLTTIVKDLNTKLGVSDVALCFPDRVVKYFDHIRPIVEPICQTIIDYHLDTYSSR